MKMAMRRLGRARVKPFLHEGESAPLLLRASCLPRADGQLWGAIVYARGGWRRQIKDEAWFTLEPATACNVPL